MRKKKPTPTPTDPGIWADPEPRFKPDPKTVNVTVNITDIPPSPEFDKAFAGILRSQVIGQLARDPGKSKLVNTPGGIALKSKSLSPEEHMEFIRGMMKTAQQEIHRTGGSTSDE